MSVVVTYSVITHSDLLPGFEPLRVHEAFSNLFKISPEKAQTLLKNQRVIKKDIDLEAARLYKKRLESIGIKVTLKEHIQQSNNELNLSLVPTDEEIKAESAPESTQALSSPKTISCPKCRIQQSVNNVQCEGCGIYMHKVLDKTTEVSSVQSVISEDTAENTTFEVCSDSLSSKSIITGTVVALVGALIWSGIASVTGYEFGFIAWVIGGAVGMSVAMSGSAGEKAGLACAAFALLAILGGKYMVFSGVKDDIAGMLSGSRDDVLHIYETEMKAADAYSSAFDDISLRQFMVDHNYSESYESGEVTSEELEYFKESEEPRISEYSYAKPAFDEWYQINITDKLDQLSVFSLIEEDFNLMDVLFLILGIGTAFRLGRGVE